MSAPVHLAAEDAIELAEMLGFLADWIEHNSARAERSLVPFVSWVSGYSPADLHDDLRRFAVLLGGTDQRAVGGLGEETSQ